MTAPHVEYVGGGVVTITQEIAADGKGRRIYLNIDAARLLHEQLGRVLDEQT